MHVCGWSERVSDRIVRCSACQEDRPVNGFGRCIVCGALVADVEVATPSRLRWHLKQNASGYLGLLLLAGGIVLIALPRWGVDVPLARAWIRISFAFGGLLAVHWLKERIVG